MLRHHCIIMSKSALASVPGGPINCAVLHFYRAMPRIAWTMLSQDVWCLSVRPSVRASHTRILSKRKPLKISSSLFAVGLPHYSSFLTPNGMAIFWREPPNGGGRMQGWYESLYLGNDTRYGHIYYTLCFKKKFTLLLFAITKSDVDRFQ